MLNVLFEFSKHGTSILSNLGHIRVWFGLLSSHLYSTSDLVSTLIIFTQGILELCMLIHVCIIMCDCSIRVTGVFGESTSVLQIKLMLCNLKMTKEDVTDASSPLGWTKLLLSYIININSYFKVH